MGLPRPPRIIFAVLAVACILTGGSLMFPPQATPNPTILPTPPRLTSAPAASGASLFTLVAAPAATYAEPPPTPTPTGGVLPLPAPPAAPDELSDDAVVKLRELAEADPAAVAEAALSQPASRLRERMLLEALPIWAERDPVAAAKWLGQQTPAREFDLGVSAVAHSPSMLALPPSMALGWASDIVDGSLRITAQRSVVQQWSQRDARQMRTALEQTRELTPKERTLLLSELDDLLAAR